jgi:mxaJ protein
MCLRFPSLVALLLLPLAAAAAELRVCAEPDNLPLSARDESGFENRLARLLAAELGAELHFEWQPQRRGFVRKTLGADICDAWMGVPADFERTLNTRPYYRSTYVFVSRDGLKSFDDPRLASLRIGVQLPGDDLAATPAGHALVSRGAVKNVIGYTVYGDGPAAARMVHAISRGELDAAVVWGAQAGYFAARESLSVARASPPAELAAMPFAFSISVGVKRGAGALRDALDAALDRRRDDVRAILDEFSVPQVP